MFISIMQKVLLSFRVKSKAYVAAILMLKMLVVMYIGVKMGESSTSITKFKICGGLGLLAVCGLMLALAVSPVSATSKNLGVTASVKDALSLALSSNTLSLDLTPTPNGIFKTDTFDATVSTSNQTGYTLYVASTGLDHNGEVTSNLIHSSPDVSSDSVISPLEGAVVVSRSGDTYTNTDNFTSDRWGLSTNTTTFKPVSTTNTIFDSYEENTSDRVTNFTFGTKVDTNIVAGTYSNILTVTAIANPVYRTFTINYDLDGGEGETVQTESIADEYYPEITINSTTPTKAYHTFLGYAVSESDAAEGTITYQPGDKISMDYESPVVELYAVWQRYWVYTLTYNYNGGSGSISPNPATATSTTTTGSFTIPSSTPTRTGYTFLGWSETNTATSADYTANSTFTITTDTSHNEASATLYAVFSMCPNRWSGSVELANKTCWYHASSSANHANAISLCNAKNMHLPSDTEWKNYSPGVTSWTGYFWSATRLQYGYSLWKVTSTSAGNVTISGVDETWLEGVLCIGIL